MSATNENDELPELVSSANGSCGAADDDSDEENWNEDDMETEPINCLFCLSIFFSYDVAIAHIKKDHNVDLMDLKYRFNMNQYSYIKMINFIRMNNSVEREFQNVQTPFWDDDKYLKPVTYESWLTFDFEDYGVNPSTISQDKFTEVEKLKQELIEKNELLLQASDDMKKMKVSFQSLIESVPLMGKNEPKQFKSPDCVGSIPVSEDKEYFESYSHFGIHGEMLNDKVRTSSYQNAILSNGTIFKDKVVLDLGCGTSILSMFASKAGARKVISVDQSDIIYNAMEIARTNNIENIEFVKGRLEDTELPENKVDIIISEWMGYFLLFEGMLDSVIYARDNHLSPNGLLLPNRCNISIAGFGDVRRHSEFVGFWKNVYGFDMSCMQTEVLKEASVEVCDPDYVLSEPVVVLDLDLMTVDVKCPNFEYDFNLKIVKPGQLTSIVGYFDTFFELPSPVEFSTSPMATPTHWKQVVFYFKELVPVNEGDEIPGRFICRRDPKDMRSLKIQLNIFNQIMHFNIN